MSKYKESSTGKKYVGVPSNRTIRHDKDELPRKSKVKKLQKKPSISDMYLEAFDLFDADGSGSISKQELLSIVLKLDLGIDDGELDNIIAEADENSDGEIDREEFLKIMKQQDQRQINKEYRETFDKFDLNKNGTIEFDELAQVMRVISEHITDEEIREMFNDADHENNGVITFDEFVFMMEASRKANEDNDEDDDHEGTIGDNHTVSTETGGKSHVDEITPAKNFNVESSRKKAQNSSNVLKPVANRPANNAAGMASNGPIRGPMPGPMPGMGIGEKVFDFLSLGLNFLITNRDFDHSPLYDRPNANS